MDKKEFDMMMEYFRKTTEEVRTSKTAAKKFLKSLGLLTTRGTPRKFRQLKQKSRP